MKYLKKEVVPRVLDKKQVGVLLNKKVCEDFKKARALAQKNGFILPSQSRLFEDALLAVIAEVNKELG